MELCDRNFMIQAEPSRFFEGYHMTVDDHSPTKPDHAATAGGHGGHTAAGAMNRRKFLSGYGTHIADATASVLLPTDIVNKRDLLILKDLQIQLEILNSLRDRVLEGDVQGLRDLLSNSSNKLSVDVPCYDEERDSFVTMMGFVTYRKNLKNGIEIMNLLMEFKASINARSDEGATPLTLACERKNIPAARLLLQKGAKLDAVDFRGWSALCAAASLPNASSSEIHVQGMQSVVLIELLIWYNAAKNGEDPAPIANGAGPGSKSKVPLMVAIQNKNYFGIQTLLQLGVSASAQPMLHAALRLHRHDNLPIILALCNAGANPHILDDEGQIPATVATALYGLDDDRTRAIRSATEQWENLFGVEPPKETSRDQLEAAERELEDERNAELRRSASAPGGKSGRGDTNNTLIEEMRSVLKSWELPAKQLLKNYNFQMTMLATLMFALFAPDMWFVFDVKDNTSLDVLLVIIMLLFIFEICGL